MKLITITSVLMLFAMGNCAALDSTALKEAKEKRWTVSGVSNYYDSAEGMRLWKVTVVAGIIMQNKVETCMLLTGENWAAAFAAALADKFYGLGQAQYLLHAWGFYASRNTATLYCTTLGATLTFTQEGAAGAFRNMARAYMASKRAIVSDVDEEIPGFPLPPPVPNDRNGTARNAGACSNKCNFNFGTHDTDICHDDFSTLQGNWVFC
jgi:hypothetical protein